MSNLVIKDNQDTEKVSFKLKEVPLSRVPRADKPKMKCSLT